MTREQVLEDILRAEAAEVELGTDALTAILTAPNPSGDASPHSPTSDAPQASPSGASTDASAGSGSATVRVMRFFSRSLLVVGLLAAVVVAAGEVYLRSEPFCPALDQVNSAVNEQVEFEGVADPGITIPCTSDSLTIDDVLNSAPEEIRDDLSNRANREKIVSVLQCLNQASTPLGLTTIQVGFPAECRDAGLSPSG